MLIKSVDGLGYEIHFVRLIYLAIFDTSYFELPNQKDYAFWFWVDHIEIIIVVLPLFMLGLRFITSPMDYPYSSKLNSLLGPCGVVPLFIYSSIDVLCLSVLVMLMNLYVTSYLMDKDDYSWS